MINLILFLFQPIEFELPAFTILRTFAFVYIKYASVRIVIWHSKWMTNVMYCMTLITLTLLKYKEIQKFWTLLSLMPMLYLFLVVRIIISSVGKSSLAKDRCSSLFACIPQRGGLVYTIESEWFGCLSAIQRLSTLLLLY